VTFLPSGTVGGGLPCRRPRVETCVPRPETWSPAAAVLASAEGFFQAAGLRMDALLRLSMRRGGRSMASSRQTDVRPVACLLD
jgi:hypothetical protein